MSKLMPVEEAWEIMKNHTLKLEVLDMDIANADGMVLAENVVASMNIPNCNISSMDGYAISKEDLECFYGKSFQVDQKIFAGQTKVEDIKKGFLSQIFTGAMLPENTGAIIIQEDTIKNKDNLKINLTEIKPMAWVRKKGSNVSAGDVILNIGDRLSPLNIGLIASIGVSKIKVFAPLKVHLLTTGDEIVDIDKVLKKGQIYNSNQVFISQLLARQKCKVTCIHIRDDLESIKSQMKDSIEQADIIVSIGGMSVGEADFIRVSASAFGDFKFWGLNLKPGKPFAFGKLKSNVSSAFLLGLPGNPVSSFITYVLLVAPFIKHLFGSTNPTITHKAKANFDIKKSDSRVEYMRVVAKTVGGGVVLNNMGAQDSHLLFSASISNALAIIPADTNISKGDELEYLTIQEIIS
jgi:molybdopterin molybdotransferase